MAGLRVFSADTLCNGFELFVHSPHGVVVAARNYGGALYVAAYHDLG